MRYIVLLAILFTVSACGQQGNSTSGSDSKEDSVAASKAMNDMLAKQAGDEKIGDEEADKLIADYQSVIDDTKVLVEKNKDPQSAEAKAIGKRFASIMDASQKIDARLQAEQSQAYKKKIGFLTTQYMEVSKQFEAPKH